MFFPSLGVFLASGASVVASAAGYQLVSALTEPLPLYASTLCFKLEFTLVLACLVIIYCLASQIGASFKRVRPAAKTLLSLSYKGTAVLMLVIFLTRGAALRLASSAPGSA
jgi:hypothetical protein